MRSELLDGRTAPVQNFLTNPSFERVMAGSTLVRKNLAAYNTRAQTAAFSLNVPSTAGLSDNRWFGSGGDGTRTRVASGGPTSDLQAFLRKTWTVTPSSSVDIAFTLTRGFQASPSTPSATSGIPVTPGKTYCISIYLRTTITSQNQILAQFRDASGNYISTSTGANTPSPSSWARISHVLTAPPGAASMEAIIRTTAGGAVGPYPQPGDTLDGTGLLIEERPAILPYFDGSTVDNSGIAYSWDGTSGASPSTARAAVVEIRRNLCIDPKATTLWPNPASTAGPKISSDRWPSEGTYAIASVSDVPAPWITTAVQYTVNTPRSGHGFHLADNPEGSGSWTAGMLPVVSGDVVTFSVYYRKTGSSIPVILRVRGTTGSTWTFDTQVTQNSSSAWQRISCTVTVPAGVSYLSSYVRSNAAESAGDVWQATGLLVEKNPLLASVFDGENSSDADLVASWTGAQNASPSLLSGVIPNGTNGNNAGRLSYQSLSLGVSCIALVPYSSFDSFAPLPYFGIRPGTTYTAIGLYYISAPQPTSGESGSSRGFRFAWQTPAGQVEAAVKGPNVAGWNEVRMTFTTPVDMSNVNFLRVYNGTAPGGGIVYFDRVAIVEGNYKGPYIDGDMPNCVWVGTPHASRSIGYPALV